MENLDAENKASQDDDGDPVARATLAASQAKTLDELRRSLTVTLTLKHKLSVQEAAEVIGRSPSWVYAARQAYLSGKQVANRNTHGGRRNQILTRREENAFMNEVCREFRTMNFTLFKGADFTREDLQIHLLVRKALEKKTGRNIPKSTVFALMERVGRRKFNGYHPRAWELYACGNFFF
ncbi:hypothetical protein C6P61_07110 [Malikia spinosa]|uniref:Uncharacterized protein n=1 Tax=Malikia spinosa TaxID=86180 RepID=A0A2S9KFG3_9BURK|nr:helix-turn-helix domain-containing protein [Malikia spinosa]PRD69191.1 hypothetical protein C6P61_07110 [Malikia spinosa]